LLFTLSLGRYPFDLNRNAAGNSPGNAGDRDFLRDWLYGWGDRQGGAAAACVASGTCKRQGATTPVARAWPMGGVQLSAPAIVAAPAIANWFNFTSANERAAFLSNFSEPLKSRRTVAYVGTLTGYLHAFSAGNYRRGNDPCQGDATPRGYFLKAPCSTSGVRDYGDGEELFAYAPRSMLSQFVRNYVGAIPGLNLAPAQVNASPAFADIDLGNLGSSPAWTIDSQGRVDKGAKTALVSATGPRSDLIFALDITDPSKLGVTNFSAQRYPIPMWEFRMGSVLPLLLPTRQPDTKGSRHSPPIIRADFGTAGKKWIAAVATDYVPNSGTAGTVYLVDMATGRPVTTFLLNLSTIGIVTLENNEGVGGEPAAVDVDADGNYDVLYVPSTSGRVFRINFAQWNLLRPIDEIIKPCAVANTAGTLSAAGVSATEAAKQGIYSPLAIKVIRDGTTKVQFFYGTADNPDDPNDPQAARYHVMAFEDTNPLGTTCTPATPLWQQQLNDGQQVWGGVSLGKDSVFAVTAVGKASDACNLSPTEDGRLYSIPQVAAPQLYPPPGNAARVKPSTSGGTVFDEHYLFVTVDGKLQGTGSDTWNNGSAGGSGAKRRMLMWQPLPPGRLP
ncbi:MAG: pilus assembly protein, partial [Archangium sp.]